MKTNQNELVRLFSDDTENLYFEIGQQLVGVGAIPLGRKELITRAKNWLDKNRIQFAEVICKDANVKKFLELSSNYERRLNLALQVADLIISMVGAIPALTVSVLLIREGLDSLCSDKKKNNDD